MKLINLTPHPIKLWDSEKKEWREYPPSGQVARVSEKISWPIFGVDGIDICRRRFGQVEGLPEPQADTFYIVSALIQQACPDRPDLLVPGDFARDEKGNIIGARALLAPPLFHFRGLDLSIPEDPGQIEERIIKVAHVHREGHVRQEDGKDWKNPSRGDWADDKFFVCPNDAELFQKDKYSLKKQALDVFGERGLFLLDLAEEDQLTSEEFALLQRGLAWARAKNGLKLKIEKFRVEGPPAGWVELEFCPEEKVIKNF